MAKTSVNDHVNLEQAHRLHSAGAFTDAWHLCEAGLKSPLRLKFIHLMAMISFSRADFEQAERHLQTCLKNHPGDALLHYQMARVHASQGRNAAAIVGFDKALELRPGYVEAMAGKADVLERSGDFATARKAMAPLVACGAIEADDGAALVHIRLLEHVGRGLEGVELAERRLAQPVVDDHSRRQLQLQAGRMLDKLGRYDEAFEVFAAARNEHRFTFSRDQLVEEFDDLIAMYSRENLKRFPRSSCASELPVFIACMPRSGSTLVEQIIHAHPRAFGGGELPHITDMAAGLSEHLGSIQPYPSCLGDLTRAKADRLAAEYLGVLKKRAAKADRVTNKDVTLYKHLGLIALLFPKSRVIHIHRDREDNAFACFMAGLSPQLFPWVCNLSDIGFAWRQYERLMAHWKATLDLPILDVAYENLVDDTETWIRRIIDFCGLEWNDRCLRYWEVERTVMTLSYDQVRRPIFKTAVKRSDRYARFLGPLKEALGKREQ